MVSNEDLLRAAYAAWTSPHRLANWESIRNELDVREPSENQLADARRIAHPEGNGLPLLGTAFTANRYEALRWNGERAIALGLGAADLISLGAGLLRDASGVAGGEECLDRAVSVGLAVNAILRDAPSVSRGVMSTDLVGAACCFALLGGIDLESLHSIIDLAGTLMVVGVADQPVPNPDQIGGYVLLAAQWVCDLHAAGLTSYPGALTDTLRVIDLSLEGSDV